MPYSRTEAKKPCSIFQVLKPVQHMENTVENTTDSILQRWGQNVQTYRLKTSARMKEEIEKEPKDKKLKRPLSGF